jgi:hypothetical protein
MPGNALKNPETEQIRALIFSRNRALQLDATLRSLSLHSVDANLVEITVLYRADDRLSDQQYLSLQKEYPNVKFVPEIEFRSDLLKWLHDFVGSGSTIYRFLSQLTASLYRPNSRLWRKLVSGSIGRLMRPLAPKIAADRYMLFLVDDNMFVSDFLFPDVIQAMKVTPSALGFSLRLGANTKYCYMLDRPQKVPEFSPVFNDVVSYNWVEAELDFSYPLEISSSIYRVKDFFNLIVSLPFGNPNQLEQQLASRAHHFRQRQPQLLCFNHSVTFCSPVNMVQDIYAGNRSSSRLGQSPAELAKKFDQGERIDIEVFANFAPSSCHQEVAFQFRNASQVQRSANEF